MPSAAMTDTMTEDFPRLLLIAVVFLIAGGVKGMTGMGLPTVAMGGLGAVMSPVAAASLLLVPSFVTNIWQLFAGPSFAKLISRLSLMMVGILVGTIAGSWVLTSAHTSITTMALGAALAFYAASGLLSRPFHVPRSVEPWLSPIVGLTTGFVTGGTGVFVIPAVPYLQALDLDKEDLIQALGLSFTVSTIALAIGLSRGGAITTHELGVSAMALVPALLGMWAGQEARKRISPEDLPPRVPDLSPSARYRACRQAAVVTFATGAAVTPENGYLNRRADLANVAPRRQRLAKLGWQRFAGKRFQGETDHGEQDHH